MYVLQAYYGLSYVMCDAKNTDGALAKISSNFLKNILKKIEKIKIKMKIATNE